MQVCVSSYVHRITDMGLAWVYIVFYTHTHTHTHTHMYIVYVAGRVRPLWWVVCDSPRPTPSAITICEISGFKPFMKLLLGF